MMVQSTTSFLPGLAEIEYITNLRWKKTFVGGINISGVSYVNWFAAAPAGLRCIQVLTYEVLFYLFLYRSDFQVYPVEKI